MSKQEELKVKIKKLSEDSIIPSYAKAGDAGLDFTATKVEYDTDIDCIVYGTGLAVEIPEGHVGLLFPRSSISKYDLSLTNCVGVIDSDYRGVIHVPIEVNARTVCTIEKGERIAQLVITKVEQMDLVAVDDLDKTKRGKGGFGSTGKKAGEVNE